MLGTAQTDLLAGPKVAQATVKAPAKTRKTDMESSKDVAHAIAAFGRVDAIPALLDVLRELTGMRLAMVAHVDAGIWTVCAVRDGLALGLRPGEPLALKTNLRL